MWPSGWTLRPASWGRVSKIRIISITQADGDKSDDDVVVFKAGSCVVVNEDGNAPDCVDGDDPRLVSADESTFATDRVTALAVDNGDYLPKGSPQYEGLVNKWPFDAEKKTYPYWDGTVGEAVDAKSSTAPTRSRASTPTATRSTSTKRPIEIAEGVDGHLHQRGGDLGRAEDRRDPEPEPGPAALPRGRRPRSSNLQAQFTPAQIKQSAEDTKEQHGAARPWSPKTVPLVGYRRRWPVPDRRARALPEGSLLAPRRSPRDTRETETTGV